MIAPKALVLAPAALLASMAVLGSMAVAPAAAQQAPSGEQLFRQRCQSCHNLAPNAGAGVGPRLRGVVGRKAGTATFAYSPALKAANVTWTKPNLDRFLAAPTRMVPGTRMVIAISDPAQRKLVVDYLATQR